MEDVIIRAEKLDIGYRTGRKHVKRVQGTLGFSLEKGTMTCLLGPNGTGKSTLLRTIGGLQPYLDGTITLNGKELKKYSEKERSRLIGLVLTDRTNAGGLKVSELVALGRYPYSGFFGRLDREDYAIVGRSLEEAGISTKAGNYFSELSDGERQKVMIAKALAQECPVILLDEPTAFLDVTSRIEIMNLLHNLTRNGKTILISTHDIEQALLLGDRLWLLSDDNGLVCGTTEDMVLGGSMDRIFSRDNITFDLPSGSFRTNASNRPAVRLHAENELLLWTKNALIRNGFRVENNSSPRDIHLTVSVKSPDSIEVLDVNNITQKFSSFEEFSNFLRQHS